MVDASPVGLGAMLVQEGKIVECASRALTDVETRYSQLDREMLAIVFGVEHFHLYIYGSPFLMNTDHKPLVGIFKSQKPATARIERLRLRLLPYEMTLEYRPGKNELNPADFISRHPHSKPQRNNASEEYVNYVTKNCVPKSMSYAEIQEATKQDSTLQKVVSAIQSGWWHDDQDLKNYFTFKEELSVHDGLILRDLSFLRRYKKKL